MSIMTLSKLIIGNLSFLSKSEILLKGNLIFCTLQICLAVSFMLFSSNIKPGSPLNFQGPNGIFKSSAYQAIISDHLKLVVAFLHMKSPIFFVSLFDKFQE